MKPGFILSFIFFLLLLLYFLHPIPLQGTNVDLGHHLLLGKITWQTFSVPQTNFVSFTEPNYVFVNNQWLSEVVFYLVERVLSFNGLIFLSILLITSTFALLFLKVREKLFYVSLVGIFYLQTLIDRTEIKPELFSYLFVSIFLFVLYKNLRKQTKLIYLLPLLMVFWINFHIFFIVGIFIILVFLLESFYKNKFSLKNSNTRVLLILLILTISASFFNPNFIKGTVYPLHVLSNYGYEVIENLNFFAAISKGYHDITFLYFTFGVVALWAGIFLYRKKLTAIDILLSSLFTLLAFFAVRNFPLFVIGTFIPIVKVLELFVEDTSNKTIFNKEKISFTIFILVLLVSTPAIITNFKLHGFGFGVIDEAKSAVNFLTENNIKGPIFNNYNIGNYLEYRLYPKEKIFVDGNPEQYPSEFFKNVYYPMEGSYESFEKYSKKYNINVIFYEHKNQTQITNPLLATLSNNEAWKIIYLDKRIIIFIKNNELNKKIIQRNEITEKNVSTDTNGFAKDQIGDLSNLFRILEWYHPMLEMDLSYLKFDPKNCVSLRHVAALKMKFNEPDYRSFLNLYNISCN